MYKKGELGARTLGGLVLVIITGIGLADPSSQLSPRRALLSPGQENYFKFMVEKLVLVICRFPSSISAWKAYDGKLSAPLKNYSNNHEVEIREIISFTQVSQYIRIVIMENSCQPIILRTCTIKRNNTTSVHRNQTTYRNKNCSVEKERDERFTHTRSRMGGH